MELADSVLWARSRDGDTDAFALLFERHAKAISNYCFGRIGDSGAAEDLLSVVFLEAWRRRRKELPPGKVLANTQARPTLMSTEGASCGRSHICSSAGHGY